MNSTDGIAAVDDVPGDTTYLFTLRETDSGEQEEAILVRQDGDPHAWLNRCQHFTHIALDKGAGATMRDGEILCTNHGAYFESDTGFCTFGPCEGAYLTEVDVAVRDGEVCLVDDDYEFVAEGPMADDDTDLTSRSNREF